MNAISPAGEFLFLAISIFLFGLIFGSFLNVCIYRLPRGMSVVHPRSACPKCGSPVASYDNIPVLSWMILRGKCRNCKTPISPRYWIVELLTGLLFVASFWKFGLSIETLKFCVFNFLILGLTFTDADLKLLPDAMTLPGLGLGIAFSLFVPVEGLFNRFQSLAPESVNPAVLWRVFSLLSSLVGAFAGAFFIWGVGWLYQRIRGVEGMGFGDVKLMAMVGSFVGAKLTLLTIMLGSLLGSFAGLAAMITVYLRRRKRWSRAGTSATIARERSLQSARSILRYYEMPFGVFLGIAAIFSAFFGSSIVHWYLSFLP